MKLKAFRRSLTFASVLAALLVANCLDPCPHAIMDDAGHDVVERRDHNTLFLDDHEVAEMTGLKRVMHRPVNKGTVFLTRGKTGGIHVQTSSAPVWGPEERFDKLPAIAI